VGITIDFTSVLKKHITQLSSKLPLRFTTPDNVISLLVMTYPVSSFVSLMQASKNVSPSSNLPPAPFNLFASTFLFLPLLRKSHWSPQYIKFVTVFCVSLL